ncbi:hypothetical protein [Streptomyces sp. b94]|uniref:hypothetical protein n=1 Tax=Streptomyces sp. b94 TaxID=1827634 RepID=UPI0035ABF94D
MGGSRADSPPGLAGRFSDGAVEPVEGVGQRDLPVERADLVLALTVADGRITAITAVIDPAVLALMDLPGPPLPGDGPMVGSRNTPETCRRESVLVI